MISRREFLGTSLAAGASLALTPELLRAFQQSGGKLLQRAIPSSGEMLPVLSYGPRPTAPPAPGPFKPMPTDVPAARDVLKVFLDNGGRVVDVLHGGPVGEQAGRTAASELGLQDKFFWTTPLSASVPPVPGTPPGPPPQADAAALKAALEEKFATFKVSKIDLVMISSAADAKQLAVLRDLKKEGRIRYIGVHHLAFPANSSMPPFGNLEALMRSDAIDFIGTDYHAGDRRLEEKLLPLAIERKIGVMAYFTFDRGRLFKRVGTTPLPEWAAEFDAKTWPQFFIKYVLSHPAVIMARTGTTNAAHMLDNIGGGIGRLPDEATRKRMAALVDTFPPNAAPAPPKPQQQAPQGPTVALSAAVLDRYVGQWTTPSGSSTLAFRREGTSLLLKANANPEVALIARSETRLQDPRGPVFEFQVDGTGAVTGVILEQGNPVQRIPLKRK
jgi:aryl-alcohol dehydrogenase-like predicted oxidoreductase